MACRRRYRRRRPDTGGQRAVDAVELRRLRGRRRLESRCPRGGAMIGGLMPMWPWDPIVDAVTAPFKAAAGWAWDTVVGGINDWLLKGFTQLMTFVWDVMDKTTSPTLDAEWFSHSAGAPYITAVGVATGLLMIFLFCALIQGIIAGRPMELVKRMAFDTPGAVAGILLTLAFTQVGINLIDAMSDGIWSLTRPKAVNT